MTPTRKPRPSRPCALAIAGSDSSGCSGIQADLKTFAALGVHGLSAITALTAQGMHDVSGIYPVAPAQLRAQLAAAFAGFRVGAVKIGMLGGSAAIEATAAVLHRRRACPVVLDPVLLSSSGTVLLPRRAWPLLRRILLPLASVLTPNLPEAEALLGRRVRQAADLLPAAHDLLASGARAVLLKGGHATGRRIRDVLVRADGGAPLEFVHARVAGGARGTGCTLASAIAAQLALGFELGEAVTRAERFVQAALQRAYAPGRGGGRALDQSWAGATTQVADREG
jgi:hydroxymethylpyrimidine/phosphomethylpyrimidine kinase